MLYEKKEVEPTFSQHYACTITLQPKTRKLSAEDQYEKYAHEVVLYDLQKIFPRCKLTLVAELTKSYDLHFHGIIQFDRRYIRKNQCIERMFRDRLRLHPIIGFVMLKVITDHNIWLDYITKSQDDFKQDLLLNPVIVDDYYHFHPLLAEEMPVNR